MVNYVSLIDSVRMRIRDENLAGEFRGDYNRFSDNDGSSKEPSDTFHSLGSVGFNSRSSSVSDSIQIQDKTEPNSVNTPSLKSTFNVFVKEFQPLHLKSNDDSYESSKGPDSQLYGLETEPLIINLPEIPPLMNTVCFSREENVMQYSEEKFNQIEPYTNTAEDVNNYIEDTIRADEIKPNSDFTRISQHGKSNLADLVLNVETNCEVLDPDISQATFFTSENKCYKEFYPQSLCSRSQDHFEAGEPLLKVFNQEDYYQEYNITSESLAPYIELDSGSNLSSTGLLQISSPQQLGPDSKPFLPADLSYIDESTSSNYQVNEQNDSSSAICRFNDTVHFKQITIPNYKFDMVFYGENVEQGKKENPI